MRLWTALAMSIKTQPSRPTMSCTSKREDRTALKKDLQPKSKPPPRAFLQQKRAEAGYYPGSPVPHRYDPIPESNDDSKPLFDGEQATASRDLESMKVQSSTKKLNSKAELRTRYASTASSVALTSQRSSWSMPAIFACASL